MSVDFTAEYEWTVQWTKALSALRAPTLELRDALDRLAECFKTAPIEHEQLRQAAENMNIIRAIVDESLSLADAGDLLAADLEAAATVPPTVQRH